MLLLKLTLVVLISKIGERALCAGSCGKGTEGAPATLPQSSLLPAPDGENCEYKVLFDGTTLRHGGSWATEPWAGVRSAAAAHVDAGGVNDDGDERRGFLVVNCTKDCPNGEKKTVTEGEACIVTVKKAADPDDVIVLVGSCDKEGSCVTKGDSDCRTITLPGPDSDESEGEDEDEEEEEEEEGEKKEE
uniref:Putative evasin n=1 Tax=Ixodes ricinus TaxID=34613 RepID=A0A6B0V003_IXORI